jgi:hypothetical protein
MSVAVSFPDFVPAKATAWPGFPPAWLSFLFGAFGV